jgi:uncharacterized RDD family membrane protein YckC
METGMDGNVSLATHWPPPMAEGSVRYAGFWSRVGALLIDTLVVWVVAFGAGGIAADAGGAEYDLVVVAYVLAIAGTWLYFAASESSVHQATLGKRALGVIVTDVGGHRISFARATGRFFGRSLSGLLLGLGYCFALFTERKQTLHDLLASTVVVRREPKSVSFMREP